MKSWQNILYKLFILVILIWLVGNSVNHKWRIVALEQAKPAFYLVPSGNGKYLKLEQIK